MTYGEPKLQTKIIHDLIRVIGDDPEREGLKETPVRVLRSYDELFAGYKMNPADMMKTFKDDDSDELIIVKNLSFTSFCEHHMLPFIGVAHIGYLPDGRVLGVSKLARVLDIYAKRLQIQERLTQQVVDALMEHLQPLGAGCIIEAKHLCMACRGVRQPEATMITSSLSGIFKALDVRSEFLRLIS